MSILTTINGQPLFETVEEALSWAAQNNLTGYHTHTYEGVIGYMGGLTHAITIASTTQVVTTTSGFSTSTTSSGSSY